MAISMITDASGTQNILSNQAVIDMSDKIYLLEPNAAPLYVLVSKLNKRVAINTTFSWIEDELNPSWGVFCVSAANTCTAMSANSTYTPYFNKGDLIKVPSTGEVMYVKWTDLTTDTTTGQICVLRAYGTSAYNTAASASFFRIGTAFEEGSPGSDLTTKSTIVTAQTNYLQIFRTSVEITKSLANTELYGTGTGDRNYQRKKKGIELMRDLERAFLFGAPKIDTTAANISAGHARRTTGGIDYFISTTATDAGGVLTEVEFETFLRTIFRWGSNTRYLLSAPLILSVISQWAQGKLQMFPSDKSYGIAISQYVSPHGTINLVKDVLLEEGGTSASSSYYGGYAYAIELEELVYRYLQNRDIQLETEIQVAGDDTYKDAYICEVGMEFHSEKKHGCLYGVTG